MAADPSYPLLPVFAFTSAALLLCVLTTNFVRQSWNLGVFFLCFWLFWTNLTIGINAIIWSDNVDIKFYVYCDIATHLNLFTAIVQPACTLILTRRVYQLASLRVLNVKGRRETLIDRTIEWFLGLGLPALVTGVFYYIVQNVRFRVVAAFGCTYAIPFTGLGIILIIGPQIILPFVSVLFYCPKIIYVFYRRYRHNQLEANRFLHGHRMVPNSDYWRILALGCIDIAFTLPVNLARFIFSVEASAPVSPISFYNGWNTVHSNWKPISLSKADLLSKSTWPLISFYVGQWSRIILALVIFCLFGLTAEARAVYRRGISRTLERFGCIPPVDTCDSIGELRFQSQSIPEDV